jgi:hypothetical protein
MTCVASIDPNYLRTVDPQQTMVTCWAASFHNFLKYYDLHLKESEIVQAITGTPTLATPQDFNSMLSKTWTDDTGRTFKLSARITDNFDVGGAQDVSNVDVVNSIADNRPVYYSNQHHSMLLVSVAYQPTLSGVNIFGGYVADPAIGAIRLADQSDLSGMYVAIITPYEITYTPSQAEQSTTTTDNGPPVQMSFTVSDFDNFLGLKKGLSSSETSKILPSPDKSEPWPDGRKDSYTITDSDGLTSDIVDIYFDQSGTYSGYMVTERSNETLLDFMAKTKFSGAPFGILGMTQDQVKQQLGAPDYIDSGTGFWYYWNGIGTLEAHTGPYDYELDDHLELRFAHDGTCLRVVVHYNNN